MTRFGIAALVLLAASATARADDVWHDPTGAFTLTINTRAWETVPADTPGVMLQLKPRFTAGYSCDVQQQPLSAGSENAPQAQFNAMMESTTREQTQAAMGKETIDAFAVSPKDGVSVVRATSYSGDEPGAIVHTSVIFVAKGAGPAATSRVACVARKSASAADQALMDKWFASLAFTPPR